MLVAEANGLLINHPNVPADLNPAAPFGCTKCGNVLVVRCYNIFVAHKQSGILDTGDMLHRQDPHNYETICPNCGDKPTHVRYDFVSHRLRLV